MVTFSHFAAFLVNVEHVLAHHPVVCLSARFRLQCVEVVLFLYYLVFACQIFTVKSLKIAGLL